jgi:hypothetical protein
MKLIKNVRRISVGDGCGGGVSDSATDALGLLLEMGYSIYEDPTDSDFVFVSPLKQPLTYKWFRHHAKTFDIDLEWWDNESDFNDRLNDDLDEVVL